MTLESVKAYYYESAAWNQITSIVEFPTISKRMDNTSMCTISIHDFEGALYASWVVRDFTPMKIEDSDSNIIFQGYLNKKKYMKDKLILIIEGFGALLEHTPFTKNYILASGLVKTVPYIGAGTEASYAIAATDFPFGIEFVDPYFYVVSAVDEKVYIYDRDYSLQSSEDVSEGSLINGICFDGTYFYIVSRGDSKIYKYTSAFVYVSNTAVTDGTDPLVDPYGICWDGTYFYITEADSENVHKYNSSFTHQDAFSISDTDTPTGITWDGTYFYIVSNGDEKVYKYNSTFTLQDSYSIATTTSPLGICWTGFYFHVVSNTDEKIFRFMSGFETPDNDQFIELKQDKEDLGYPDFEWTPDDYWINNQDVAIMISDNTNAAETKTWKASAVATDKTEIQGDEESTWSKNDGDVYFSWQGEDLTDQINTVTMDAPLGGDEISTSYTPIAINIDFWFGHSSRYGKSWLYFQIKKGDDWVTIASNYRTSEGKSGKNYFGYTIILEEDLTEYLEDSDANDTYDKLKGMRVVLDPTGYYDAGYGFGIIIDYISVTIDYTVNSISPIMEHIDQNGASWICSNINWNTSGVQADDIFSIGENTTTILQDIDGFLIDIGIELRSTLSKYMARYFRGSNCMEALRSVCQLEGLHWAEDHVNKLIIVSKSADFEDSGIDIDVSKYDPDFEIEDDCNDFKGVIVYGNASLHIKGIDQDPDSDSLLWKQVFNDNLMTNADAQAVAEELFLKIKNKRPSYKLSVIDTDGTYSALEPMKTVDLTFTRPTIAVATQPIRRIDITRIGEHLKYVGYYGFGSTPEEEKEVNLKKELASLINQLNVFRLTNTPLGGGANLSPSDIAGLDTYILSLLSSNAAVSIEWDDDDPAAADIEIGDITVDSSFHELDFDDYGPTHKSKTVPTGTIMAIAQGGIKDNTTSSRIFIRASTQSNSFQSSTLITNVSNVWMEGLLLIPIDENHVFDYYVTNNIDNVKITILAWVKIVE